MKYNFLGVTVFSFIILIGIAVISAIMVLVFLTIKALIRYIKSENVRKEKSGIKKSLGEVLKQRREECKMTQEFVAEAVGVSRQAVSKWENGISDPSTSNLIALARLFEISVEDILRQVQ